MSEPCVKVSHPTASGAHAALRRQLKWSGFRRIKGLHLEVYRCAICTQWHIGNAKDETNDRQRRRATPIAQDRT